MSDERKSLVSRLIDEAWNQGNIAFVDEHVVAPDDESTDLAYLGPDGVKRLVSEYHQAFPESELTVRNQFTDGNTVLTNVESRPKNGERHRLFAPSRQSDFDFTLIHQFVEGQESKVLAAEAVPKIDQLANQKSSFVIVAQRTVKSVASQPSVRHIALSLALITSIIFLYQYLVWDADDLAKQWLNHEIEYLGNPPELAAIIGYSNTDESGRFVAFVSDVDELVNNNDRNHVFDVFVHDREENDTRRISASLPEVIEGKCQGEESNGWSIEPIVSDDGRYVVFHSNATNLVDDENVNRSGAYVHDMENCETVGLEAFVRKQAALDHQDTYTDTAISLVYKPIPSLSEERWRLEANPLERARLLQQHAHVRSLALRHLNIIRYYYEQSFGSYALALVLAISAAVALLLITRTGWSGANPYVLNTFVVLTAASIFFGVLPNVYSYSRNIETNMNRYVVFSALENQIRGYLTTGYLSDETETSKSLSVKDFTLHVDRQLLKTLSLPLELDPQAIPDINSVLQQLSVTQGTVPEKAVAPTPP